MDTIESIGKLIDRLIDRLPGGLAPLVSLLVIMIFLYGYIAPISMNLNTETLPYPLNILYKIGVPTVLLLAIFGLVLILFDKLLTKESDGKSDRAKRNKSTGDKTEKNESDTEKEVRKRMKEFVSPVMRPMDIVDEQVTRILNKYFDNHSSGLAEGDFDIIAPSPGNPKIYILLRDTITTENLIDTTNRLQASKIEFPDSKFILITDLVSLPSPPPPSYRKLLDSWDAVFDIQSLNDFEAYVKRQVR